MYRNVRKRKIRRTEEIPHNSQLEMMKHMIDCCREADDELWHELIVTYLDDLQLLQKLKEK